MRVQKNPHPLTRANTWDSLAQVPAGVTTEEMTSAEFAAWLAAQPPIPEVVPVPTNLPAWRIRAVLRRRGLLTNVKQLLASLPQAQRDTAEEQLVDSRFERDHPLVEQLGKALNLTSKDIDDIFREADALV